MALFCAKFIVISCFYFLVFCVVLVYLVGFRVREDMLNQ